MSKRDFNLIAVKKPRDNPIQDKPINFPPLQNLHLELLENKKKIKSGLPNVVSSQKIIPPKKDTPPKNETPKEPIKKDTNQDTAKKIVPQSSKKEPPPKKDVKQEPSKNNTTKQDPPSKKNIPKQDEPHPDELILEEIIDDEDILEEDSENNLLEDELGDSEDIPSNISDDLPAEDNLDPIEDEEPIEEEIEEPIEEEIEEETPKEPDDGLTPEERERREKEEYIWRFRILKKKYPNPKVDIPDYNEHSDLTDMKNAYDRTTRELYLDGAVDSYRTYLVGGFMVTEFVCNNWLNIDLEGFTSQQAKMMYKYDMLLIELGEKSYNKWGMNIPVEIRLAGLILLQAGLFYLGKIITANYGGNVASIFKGISGQPPDRSEIENEEPVKKKMKGPKFKADDIRNMTKGKKE